MLRSRVSQYALKSLLVVIRLRLVRSIFFWCLENMSELLPVNKISETDSLICFYHPQPDYPVHILLVPKKDIRDLSQLDPMENEFLPDMFSTVRTLIEELDLEKKGYRLIVNGGEYQKFPQLHFHLVSGG
ncbi:MAG: HIT domain-containing protein [Anaerolineales bacterium]